MLSLNTYMRGMLHAKIPFLRAVFLMAFFLASASANGSDQAPCVGLPTRPENAKTPECGAYTESGNSCTLECLPGYTASGDFDCTDGIFSEPTCEENACSSTPDLAHGDVTCDEVGGEVPAQTTCSVTCDDGYSLSESLTCVRGSFTAAVCEPDACETNPPAPENGVQATCGSTSSGGFCDPNCNEGYLKSAKYECTAGEWSDVTCDPLYCVGSPDSPDWAVLGSPSCEEYTYSNDTCELECMDGFTKSGDFLCTAGSWSAETCQPNSCESEPDDTPNGSFTCDTPVASGSNCSLSCDEGYTSSGDPTCSRGEWSTSWCEPDACSAPTAPENAVDHLCPDSLPSGEQCGLQCKTGYMASFDYYCTAGSFSPMPFCHSGAFEYTPNVAYASASAFDVIEGDSALDCEAPCHDISTCEAFTWDETSGCLLFDSNRSGPFPNSSSISAVKQTDRRCQTSPTIENGSPNCNWTASGNTCSPNCDENYIASDTLTCTDGEWNDVTCDQAQCEEEPVYEGPGSVGECSTPVTIGGSCELSCEDGYSKTGDFVCQGTTFTSPACKPNACLGSPEIENGVADCGALTLHGNNCESPTCNPGYTLTDAIVCELGDWTGGSCAPDSCPSTPPQVENADETTCNPSEHGDTCAINCNDGFEQTSPYTCHLGSWTQPACLPLRCEGNPDEVEHGNEPNCGPSTASGATCELVCDEGTTAVQDYVCLSGDWVPGLCQENECGSHPGVDNGEIECQEGECDLTCDDGFVPTGHPSCVKGKYTPAACVGAPCFGIPEVELVRSNITLSNLGGSGEGSGESGSGELGSGSGDGGNGGRPFNVPTFDELFDMHFNMLYPEYEGEPYAGTVSCGQPDPRRATREMTSHGKDCTVDCIPGLTKTGDAKCRFGNFSKESCIPDPCLGAPPCPVNTQTPPATNLMTASGTAVTFSCLPGYTRSSDFVCFAGKWNAPVCEPDSCMRPNSVRWGSVHEDCKQKTEHGDYCKVVCDEGYEQSENMTCHLGQFRGGNCQPRSCKAPPPKPDNAVEADWCSSVTKHQGTCPLVCEPGFVGSRKDYVCDKGTWSEETCMPESCNSANLMPPQFSKNLRCETQGSTDSVAHGDGCTFNCINGYEPSGTIECSEGKFSAASCVPKTCGAFPTIRNGEIGRCLTVSPERREAPPRYAHGQQCSILCDEGYSPTADLECEFGNWTEPQCKPMGCVGQPDHVLNGRAPDCDDTTEHGESCELECDRGYEGTGNYDCQYGSWSSPTCMPQGCSTDLTIPNGRPNFDSCSEVGPGRRDLAEISHGLSCDYECDEGYAKDMYVTRLSCLLGSWESGKCNPESCAEPPELPESAASSSCLADSPHGTSCELLCNAGYTPSDEFTCRKGQWTEPECQPASCGTIPVVPFGDVDRECDTDHDSSCNVECNAGYVKDPNNRFDDLFCSLGRWVVPKCVPAPCERPPQPVANGELQCEGEVEHGSKCAIDCDEGFSLTGEYVCQFGQFEGTPRCGRDVCIGQPPEARWGMEPRCNDVTPDGEFCDLVCMSGFTATGDYECDKGEWRVPTCDINPCLEDPPKPNFATSVSCGGATGAPYANGTECTLDCVNGFKESGPSFCIAGEWTEASCEVKPCQGNPDPPQNALEPSCGEETPHTGSCPLYCEEGYVADDDYACVLGNWISGSCVEADCADSPTLPLNAASVDDCDNSEHGDTCSFTCNEGFSASGNVTCVKGVWSQGTCDPSSCDTPPTAPENGVVGCVGSTDHDSECTLSCNEGYAKTGDFTCLFGEFDSPTCEDAPCTQLPNTVENGIAPTCVFTESGSTCELACMEGYTASSNYTCTSGSFDEPSCNPDNCASQPEFPDNADSESSCTESDHGDTCRFTCNEGYTPEGSFSCHLGEWTGEPSCNPAACTSSPSIANAIAGTPDCAVPNAHMGTCRFVCEPGYEPTDVLTCSFGEYDEQSCEPIGCDVNPPSVEHADINCDAEGSGRRRRIAEQTYMFAHDETCAVTCNEGYEASGNQEAVCSFGEWTSSICEPIGCTGEDAPSVDNGSVSCEDSDHGDECELSCNEGYVKTGNLHCDKGEWSTELCEPLPCPGCPAAPEYGQSADCGLVTPDGSSCTTICNDGYTKDSDYMCNTGTWSEPTCVPDNCGAEPSLPELATSLSCAGTDHGLTCTVQCTAGTTPSGFFLCSAGSWNDVFCVPDACEGNPDTPDFSAAPNCSDKSAGATCAVPCNEGYTQSADFECELGQWSQPTCLPHPCVGSPDTPENAEPVDCGVFTLSGDPCSLTCSQGYDSSGNFTCTAGEFDSQSCAPKSCSGTPTLPNNADPSTDCGSTTAHEGSCTLLCNSGYVASGTFDCSLGEFSEETCDEAPCEGQPDTVDNAAAPDCGASTESGSTCTLDCNEGYSKSADWLCTRGDFSGPTCDPDPCEGNPDQPANGPAPNCGASTEHEGTCGYTCNDGYTGSDTEFTCSLGTWSTIVCDPDGCDGNPATPDNAQAPSCSPPADHEESCMLECNEGYTKSDDFLCSLGQWSSPNCSPSPCEGNPDTPNNAQDPSCGDSTEHGSECTLTCNSGFDKSGDFECSFGEFSEPTCTPTSCDVEPVISNAPSQNCGTVDDQDTCTPTCNEGYVPSGDFVCEKGSYQTPLPTCDPIPCTGSPATPQQAETVSCGDESAHGTTCPLNCNENFIATGAFECSFGQWSSAQCEHIGTCSSIESEEDTGRISLVGNWNDKSKGNFVGESWQQANIGQEASLFGTFVTTETGEYQFYTIWKTKAAQGTSVSHQILTSGQVVGDFTVNQAVDLQNDFEFEGQGFEHLGAATLPAGSVTWLLERKNNDASTTALAADALYYCGPTDSLGFDNPILVDSESDDNVVLTGDETWRTRNNQADFRFGDTYIESFVGELGTFTNYFQVRVAGVYKIFANWKAGSVRPTRVPIQIIRDPTASDSDVVTTLIQDQSADAETTMTYQGTSFGQLGEAYLPMGDYAVFIDLEEARRTWLDAFLFDYQENSTAPTVCSGRTLVDSGDTLCTCSSDCQVCNYDAKNRVAGTCVSCSSGFLHDGACVSECPNGCTEQGAGTTAASCLCQRRRRSLSQQEDIETEQLQGGGKVEASAPSSHLALSAGVLVVLIVAGAVLAAVFSRKRQQQLPQ
eukprot:m.219346 g.219346  ORF g.219346 m.219346 type:complete len:3133 (-) comp26284_c0_seq1:107-9505(-)